MKFPFAYHVNNLRFRWANTLATSFGIAVVVATFLVILSIAEGFRNTVVSTGSPENYIVQGKSARTYRNSFLSKEQAGKIASCPGIARNAAGALAQAESVITVYMPRKGPEDGAPQYANITLRGMSGAPEALREVELVAGRMFRPGMNELVAGQSLPGRFRNLALGEHIRLNGAEWEIVGHFRARGSSESELWGDADQIVSCMTLKGYNCVLARVESAEDLAKLENHMAEDAALKDLAAIRQSDYYADQADTVTSMIRVLCALITAIMAAGAIFSVLQYLHNMVDQRRKEIGIFLALGFPGWEIGLHFLFESVSVAIVGGAIGCALSLLADGISTGTLNAQTFSEVSFRFEVTLRSMSWGMLLAVLMGLAGGILPAWSASRKEVVKSLRDF